MVVGTTGESPTVDFDEHKELIRIAVQHSRGRIPIIAGTGGNSTVEAIELTASAKENGATACLSVVPYYNKPTQEGLYRHFRKIAETVDLPMILYNVPGRTVADMQTDTVLRLAQVPGIIGIKEASANIERNTDLIRRAPRNFAIYSGDDATALALILLGGHGVISVTANVAPKAMHQMCAAALVGDLKKARELNLRLFPLHQQPVRRGEPDPGQVGARRDGHDRERPATADVAAGREVSPDGARGAPRSRDRSARTAGRGRTGLIRKILASRPPRPCCLVVRSDTGVDYKKAGTLPPLEVPPDLTSPARDNRYVVPESGALQRHAVGIPGRAARAAGARARARRRCCPRSSACASSAPARNAGWWCRSRRRSSGRW